MTRENVEIIQRLYEAFIRRDFDGAVQCLHRDFELHAAITGPDWRSRERCWFETSRAHTGEALLTGDFEAAGLS
jgi:ketosteroid isomerase-like protein